MHLLHQKNMTLKFSTAAMQAMGFREFAEDEALVASFSSLTVYEVRGIDLCAGSKHTLGSSVANTAYRLTLSTSINEGCFALLGDIFAEDEDEWKKEKKCQGPFVLLLVGPTAEHTCKGGHVMVEGDGSLTTYDCFAEAGRNLALLESKVVAPVVSALTCILNDEDQHVALRKIERVSFGRSGSGAVVHDIRMDLRAEGHTAYKLPQLALAEKLQAVATLAGAINQKASRFFALGLAEEDQLKRFLYFFLALEIETHAVFVRIDHAEGLKKMLDGASARSLLTTQLLCTQVHHLKNLYDRFVWCAACVWIKLDEDDVAKFKVLKRARDDIAHGSASEPPPGFARDAELLAHKVLRIKN